LPQVALLVEVVGDDMQVSAEGTDTFLNQPNQNIHQTFFTFSWRNSVRRFELVGRPIAMISRGFPWCPSVVHLKI